MATEKTTEKTSEKTPAENVETVADGVVEKAPVITDEQLREIDSFEAALALAEQTYGEVINIAEELGTGFAILNDKSRLVGEKCLILKWGFTNGDHGKSFASLAVVTKRGEKFIVNDGGTGICEQLKEYSVRTNRYGGLIAENGFRASNYPTCKSCGVPRPTHVEICANAVCGDPMSDRGNGTTYYLDLSA